MSASWHMTIDETTQKPFYYNSETKETTWTAPPGFQGSTPPHPAQEQQQSNPMQSHAAPMMSYATPVQASPVANPWNKTQVKKKKKDHQKNSIIWHTTLHEAH